MDCAPRTVGLSVKRYRVIECKHSFSVSLSNEFRGARIYRTLARAGSLARNMRSLLPIEGERERKRDTHIHRFCLTTIVNMEINVNVGRLSANDPHLLFSHDGRVKSLSRAAAEDSRVLL